MKTIWKFTITPPKSVIEIPENAKLLTVREQANLICLWALVDPSAPIVRRKFSVFGTGHIVNGNNLNFVGTAMPYNAELVWHVFEECNEL